MYGTGYVAALLDANDPTEGGIQTVLTGLSESIKEIERQKYTKAIFTQFLHGCSWYQLCEIARILLEDYQAIIPERLAKCYPAQLVDEIPSLISMFISGDSFLQQITFSSEKSRLFEIPFIREPQ
jgi:hypothetical protein